MTEALFYMWGRHKARLIDSHNFYMDQAKQRLLSQFDNMEEAATDHANNWLEAVSSSFDPDCSDPSSYYEQAAEERDEFWKALESMQARTRFSIASGFFHEWDKELRRWLTKEIARWHTGSEFPHSVWAATFDEIINFLEGLGWPVKSEAFFTSLEKLATVVNAYKHGEGRAFEKIKTQYPEFLTFGIDDKEVLNLIGYTSDADLRLQEKHLEEFSDTIVKFWESLPEYLPNKEGVTLPERFGKAYEKDQKLHGAK